MTSLVGTLASASLATAQTTDHVFRSWRWQEETLSARAAGLGGAFVAVADDFSTALLNPAGLATVPSFLEGSVGATVLGPRASSGPDTIRFPQGHGHPVSPPAGLARLGCGWGVALSSVAPLNLRIDLGTTAFPDGSRDAGFAEAWADGVGLAAAFRRDRLSIGANLSVSWLSMRADASSFDARGALAGRVRVDDKSDGSVTWTAGAVYSLARRWRLGASYRPGTTWTVQSLVGAAAPTPSTIGIRAPSLGSAGLAWTIPAGHRGAWLTTAVQLDRVGYSALRAGLTPGRAGISAADYRLDDAFEPRLGVEASIPTACWHGCGMLVQLRGGLHSQAAGSLHYTGGDPVEAAAFAGSTRRWRPALGASLASQVRIPFATITLPIRLDSAATFGAGRPSIVVALALRYGVTFRDRGPR